MGNSLHNAKYFLPNTKLQLYLNQNKSHSYSEPILQVIVTY